MEWVKEAPEQLWKYKAIVLSKVRLIDIIIEYGLSIDSNATGQFSHRARCPFHEGKGPGGKEKTPSLYISDKTNSFHCFGCGAGNNVIDFVSMADGSPPALALEKLAKKSGLLDKDGHWDELQLEGLKDLVLEPKETIEPYLFEISTMLRNHISQHVGKPSFDRELIWTEKVSSRVDEFLSQIGHEDWEYAKDLSDKVERTIAKREKQI